MRKKGGGEGKKNKKEVLRAMSRRSYGGWFLRIWMVEEVWLEYICARVPTEGRNEITRVKSCFCTI